MGSASPRRLRIGVDVGGTNTDGVVLDPSLASDPSRGILAWHKAATTTNPSDGISAALAALLGAGGFSPADVASVTIGTTHFVNAVVERDPARLQPVAVIRLAGPFGKHTPPCVDWPADMRRFMLAWHTSVRGGLEVDGSLIAELDEDAVRAACAEIRARGIRAVVVNGVFSPIDAAGAGGQEDRAAAIVQAELGSGVDVVRAREVANLGFLERENAAILNAAILRFARRTIRAFREPVKRLGLNCPVFITQNDGTILSGETASRLPIRTFSSGPTNSMRGAAFLATREVGKQQLDENMMVVDIGGTTTDVGLLLANGFPRQQAAYSDLAGVRMNFSCPDIKSIGLGGGSIVRRTGEGNKTLTVGPESVGYKLTKEAKVFGGDVLTTTDCTVLADPSLDIGNAELVKGALTDAELAKFKAIVKHKIEKVIDTMKTSPEDLPVLLVGGGAVIAPDELIGASRVIKPKWSSVANAIGAAIARVSGVVDTVKSTDAKSSKQLLEEICNEAIEKTVEAGAAPESVKIVEMETLPLQYVANKSRFIVRAAGDFDFSRTDLATTLALNGGGGDGDDESLLQMDEYEKTAKATTSVRNPEEPNAAVAEPSHVDIDAYRPDVRSRVWHISETDLDWISTGCYILGTGGGGSPYPHMIRLREMLRAGAVVRVVNPRDVADGAAVGGGGGMGSPTVSIEKLQGDEMMDAQRELFRVFGADMGHAHPSHMIAMEIGGGNGLQGMILGASTNMDVPAIDGDWMGRAYPTKWQTTPVVFDERRPVWSPCAMTDGNGNVVVMPRATSDLQVERIFRAALSQMGSHTGCAESPVSGAEMKRWVVEHTISQAWRIGRAVARARARNRVDSVAETIIDECGGPGAAKVLFKGKIVGVQRTLHMGHVYGECFIEGADVVEDGEEAGAGEGGREPQFTGLVKIPFKNENIAVLRTRSTDADVRAAETQDDVLAIVPDLISVIDAQNGEAVGTPEYRYGLLVVVLGIAASNRWTSTPRGIEIGGPRSFGFDHLEYRPLCGMFVPPVSVIDEFDNGR